jgi:hypothetical protein
VSESSSLSNFDNLLLDDIGADCNIANSAMFSGCYNIMDIVDSSSSIAGIGSARVVSIGSFIGDLINRDGTLQRFRIGTVNYLGPNLKRSIFGSAVHQLRKNIRFYRNVDDDRRMEIQVSGAQTKRMDLYRHPDGVDPFLYFQFRHVKPDQLGEVDKRWLEDQRIKNSLIAGVASEIDNSTLNVNAAGLYTSLTSSVESGVEELF